ncbi:hypothetical protein [Streptomyces coerulescens]|uniref:Secreted protein n=1 Tax=Streptomyces coerulescens TaxID=29304 RepID=A0ABW0CQQ3_STRCD
MTGRVKVWLAGGWLVLVVAGWSFTESINDGIEPTSGPRPEPSSSSSPKCPAPTSPTPEPTATSTAMPSPTPSIGTGREITDYHVATDPDLTVTAVACIVAD